MKRTAHPPLSSVGHEALASYERWLREREDLAAASIRNYLSDLRHFIAWYETERETTVHDEASFTPKESPLPRSPDIEATYRPSGGRNRLRSTVPSSA
jgi:hypothetical protein